MGLEPMDLEAANNEIEENKRKFKDLDFYIIESFVFFFLISKNFN